MHALDEYDLARLSDEELVLLIASTFGNGDPPANGVVSRMESLFNVQVCLCVYLLSFFSVYCPV